MASDVPETRVGHCKRDRCDVYIGRGSRWGNPFVFPGKAARSKHHVVESKAPLFDYEVHVRASPELMAALPELQGKVLGCWCVRLDEPDEPERCHGHVLQRIVREVCCAQWVVVCPDEQIRHFPHLNESDAAFDADLFEERGCDAYGDGHNDCPGGRHRVRPAGGDRG